jgi:phospho-N-acetylmuramoyl-pentapeptide-transferase
MWSRWAFCPRRAAETVTVWMERPHTLGTGSGLKAILLSGASALVVSLFITRWAIVRFSSWGLGQLIRDDGPRTHHVKRGTPTMGGAAIVVSVVIGYTSAKLLTRDVPSRSALLVLFVLVGMAGVGFLDDYIKVKKQRSLGLRSKAKLLGQTVVSLSFGVLALQPSLSDGEAARSRSGCPWCVTSARCCRG